MAVKGLLNPGDTAVTTVMEHNSVLRPLYEMEAKGVNLKMISTDAVGRLDMEAMKRAVFSGAAAVFCTHASNLTGNVNDIRQIGPVVPGSGGSLCCGRFPERRDPSDSYERGFY